MWFDEFAARGPTPTGSAVPLVNGDAPLPLAAGTQRQGWVTLPGRPPEIQSDTSGWGTKSSLILCPPLEVIFWEEYSKIF